MKVTFYDNAQDNVPKVVDLTWDELAAKLSTHRRSPRCAQWPCNDHRCPGKNGAAWSPVEITDRRLNANVVRVTVAVFDLDHVKPEALEPLLELERGPYAYVLHSTHRHNPPEEFALRLVMPLSRPCTPAEYPAVRAAAIATLKIPADPATKDLSRIYFLPNAPENVEPWVEQHAGGSLDVEELLEIAGPGVQERQGASSGSPAPSDPPIEVPATVPVDLHELVALLKRHAKPENRALIAQVLRGEAVAPPRGGPYGGQDNALQALMSTIAFCVPNETPDEAILHLIGPSLQATDWREGLEHLMRNAVDKLHRARERKVRRDAARLAENEALREALGIPREVASSPQPSPLDEDDKDDPDAWAKLLIWLPPKKGETPKLKNCELNVETVLRHSPQWRGVLRFNDVEKKLECVNPPKGIVSAEAEGLDIDIALWFQRSEWGKLGLTPSSFVVQDVLRQVIRANTFDPLREFLEGLKWDGSARIDTFLERYFGAAGDDPAYLRAVSRRWLLSLVARGLRPGEKVDTVLVLEGKQGLRKSTALEVLTAPWFCDSKIDIASKDTWALAAQWWLLELAETEGMNRAQADALKAFFSRRKDSYRPPYGKVNSTTPRRALFAATTNGSGYLKFDPSGYRRYWCVTCTKIDLEALRRDRDQLLAEAVAAVRAGDQWWLTKDEEPLAREASKKREETVSEFGQTRVLDWLLSMEPEKRPRRLRLLDVLTHPDVFGLQVSQITKAKEMEASDTLKALGFERMSTALGKAWKTPKDLLTEPIHLPTRTSAPSSSQTQATSGGLSS